MSDVERLGAALAGRYRIDQAVGAGGMATVYLAHDLRHDRRVALKVLRPELSAVIGAERFLQEIRVTAHLQHPHILPLFDSGEADHLLYYVMPYVEGVSLRERLKKEVQLGVDDTLRIAVQVAGALDYAHRHGVVHRDIKPENILLHDGQAVVADFGIALAVRNAGGARLTETGLSLGTPHYMSPEQATADRELDARSDIYSLGSVVYEMLAGEPPHSGPSAQAIISKIITERPRPLTDLRDTVPLHVAAAVHKALAKLPADRFATAAQFADALERPGLVPTVATTVPVTAFRSAARRRPVVAALAVAAAVVLGALGFILGRRGAPPRVPVRYFSIILPDSAPLDFFAPSFYGEGRRALVITPDGSTLVYVARVRGRTQLYRRPLDRDEATPIPGTEGAADPIVSPDGEWIAFIAGGELRKIALAGGAATTIAPAGFPVGMAWLPDGRIVEADYQLGLVAVPAAGGEWGRLWDSTTAILTTGGYPAALPGGRWLVGVFDGALAAHQLEGGRLMRLAHETGAADRSSALVGSNPLYAASGHLLYLVDSTLMALPFTPDPPQTRGAPVSVVQGVRRESWAGAGQVALALDGTLVYAPGRDAGTSVPVWVDRSGRLVDSVPLAPGNYLDFQLAPDGRTATLGVAAANARPQYVVVDLDRGLTRRLPVDTVLRVFGWMPDGRGVFLWTGKWSLAASVTGSASVDTLAGPGWMIRGVSPSGVFLVGQGEGDSTGLWLWPRTGGAKVRVQRDPGWPRFSPDGRWLAFTSAREGLTLSPVPATGETFKIAPAGADEPVWSPGGDAVYYRMGPRWYEVPVSTRERGRAGEPREMFSGRFLQVQGKSFGVDPRGRFLVLAGPPGETTTRLNVVTNFFAELKRLAPSGDR